MQELVVDSIGFHPLEEITTPPNDPGGTGPGAGPNTVIVVGNPAPEAPAPGPGTGPGTGDPGSGGDGGETGGGGSGGGGGIGPGYTPLPGASAAATSWADDHVAAISSDPSGNGITDREIEYVQRYHDDLSRLYDWAQSHLNDSFDLGHGKFTTVEKVFEAIDAMVVNVYINPWGPQPNPYFPGQFIEEPPGPSGAISRIAYVEGAPEFNMAMIYVQPGNKNVTDYHDNYQNDTGLDYLLFHEIGHVVEGFLNDRLQAEGAGNYVGRELQEALGLAPLTDMSGNIIPATNGYEW